MTFGSSNSGKNYTMFGGKSEEDKGNLQFRQYYLISKIIEFFYQKLII